MPAGRGTASQIGGGQEIIDLKVCMSLLKRTIVLFPLLIMVIIFLVKAHLTTYPKDFKQVKSSFNNSKSFV